MPVIPQEVLLAADMTDDDSKAIKEAAEEAGFILKVHDLPGYVDCDCSQPRFYCGEYNFRDVTLAIEFIERFAHLPEWKNLIV